MVVCEVGIVPEHVEGMSRNQVSAKTKQWLIVLLSFRPFTQPLPFLRLMPASNKFLGTFFTNLFISTQTNSPLGNISPTARRESSPIESIFLQLAMQNANAAQGVGWYLQNSQTMRKQASKNELIAWGIETALEALRASEAVGL